MTDAAPAPVVGVSDITASPDPAAAASQMESLKATPEFMERVRKGEPEAFDQYNRLWRLSRGMSETPQPPETVVDVESEIGGRLVAQVQQHADVLRGQGFDENQILEIIGQRPITMQERDYHKNQIALLRRDQDFMRRWSAGDLKAIQEIQRHSVALSLPIGTLAEIEAWENG